MAQVVVQLQVRVALWLRAYLACAAFAALLGIKPNMDRIERLVHRGVKVSVT